MESRATAHPRVLYLIAVFKLFKGLVLFAIGVGALHVLNKGAAIEMYRWAYAFRAGPATHSLRRLLVRLPILNDKSLRELSVGTFFYSALFLTEGAGLMLRKRWAEYFTIIENSSLIPLEVYELMKRASFVKGIVLMLNVAVVVFLAMNLRRHLE